MAAMQKPRNVTFKMRAAQRQWLEDNVFRGGIAAPPSCTSTRGDACGHHDADVARQGPNRNLVAQKNRDDKERRRQAKKDGMTSVSVDDDGRDPKKQRATRRTEKEKGKDSNLSMRRKCAQKRTSCGEG
jgi:hypothetical protein